MKKFLKKVQGLAPGKKSGLFDGFGAPAAHTSPTTSTTYRCQPDEQSSNQDGRASTTQGTTSSPPTSCDGVAVNEDVEWAHLLEHGLGGQQQEEVEPEEEEVQAPSEQADYYDDYGDGDGAQDDSHGLPSRCHSGMMFLDDGVLEEPSMMTYSYREEFGLDGSEEPADESCREDDVQASRHVHWGVQYIGSQQRHLRDTYAGDASDDSVEAVKNQRLADIVANTNGAVNLNIDYGAEIQLLDSAPIGQGQFGSVFRGRYHDQLVAIKMLPRMFLGDASTADMETFVQEVCVLSSVEHANVVKFFGGCLQPPYVFIVEELMSHSLSDLLYRQPGTFPMWRVLQVALDIANGLEYLHHLSPPIVHRDLKPENILMDDDGTSKISDFGLARCKYQSYVKTNRPEAGTLAYMAPECFDSKVGKLTDKADIFSFGVVLWEMVMRMPPWQGMKAHDFLQRMVLGGSRLEVPQDDNVCPLALRRLITDCWDDDPEGRPSCAHIKAELERLLRYCRRCSEDFREPLRRPKPGEKKAST